jgi:hypothetical protein
MYLRRYFTYNPFGILEKRLCCRPININSLRECALQYGEKMWVIDKVQAFVTLCKIILGKIVGVICNHADNTTSNNS